MLEILSRAAMLAPQWLPPLQLIVRGGTLPLGLSRALGSDAGQMPAVYREMCACLRNMRMFAA